MFDITTRDIKYLQGVGPQRATVLNKELNLFSLHDLLYYFPYKYVDRSRLYYIHEIDGNMPYIQLKGEILSFETLGEGRQRRLVGHFSDGTGIIDLVWFQGIKYLLEHYKTRTEYIVFGKPYSMAVSMWLIPIWTLQANLPYLRWGCSLIITQRKG